MWDKKGEDISYKWLRKLKQRLLVEQEEGAAEEKGALTKPSARQFTGARESDEALAALSAEDLVKYAMARAQKCNLGGNISVGNKNAEKVKLIQMGLKKAGANITDPEGEFGQTTLVATLTAQKKVGIRIDGCVGPETVGALGLKVKTGSAGIEGQVKESELPGVKYVDVGFKTGKLKGLKYIIIHESVTSTAAAAIRVLLKRGLSVHITVDTGGQVEQHAPLNRATWSAGHLNRYGISVEVINRSSRGAPSKRYRPGGLAQMEATYDVCKKISSATGIPMNFEAAGPGVYNYGKIGSSESGVIAHGSDKGSTHSDARFPVLYMALRHSGMGSKEAYESAKETTQNATRRNKSAVPTPGLK